MEPLEYLILDDLLYTKEHDWVRLVNHTRAIVGVTDYAVKMLKEVVYVSLPPVGSEVKQMDVFGSVESIKAVSDLYTPLSGKVIKVNERLNTNPELVHQSPYQDGWIIEIQPLKPEAEVRLLLDSKGYASLLRELIAEKV